MKKPVFGMDHNKPIGFVDIEGCQKKMNYELNFKKLPIEIIESLEQAQTVMQMMMYKMRNELENNLENKFKECLKKRGFEFENEVEFLNFVKARCKMEDYYVSKEKIFYVDETPVYRWLYESKIEWEGTNTLTSSFGK